VLAGFSLLVFVPSPPAWRRPVEFGSTSHAVMVGNECVALLAHVLLAICDQTLLAVCVKAGLIPKTSWLCRCGASTARWFLSWAPST
jgi:hypothetical protein